MKRETPVKVFGATDLKDYLKSYDDCGYSRNGGDDLNELVSLIEQEIVYLSNIFVRSVVSSWSLNVQIQRSIEGRDREDVTNYRILSTDGPTSAPSLQARPMIQQNQFGSPVQQVAQVQQAASQATMGFAQQSVV